MRSTAMVTGVSTQIIQSGAKGFSDAINSCKRLTDSGPHPIGWTRVFGLVLDQVEFRVRDADSAAEMQLDLCLFSAD